MSGLPTVDEDFCPFADCGFQKPTRIFGSVNVTQLQDKGMAQREAQGLAKGARYARRPKGALREGGGERWQKVHTTEE